jgi:hypothetical protein
MRTERVATLFLLLGLGLGWAFTYAYLTPEPYVTVPLGVDVNAPPPALTWNNEPIELFPGHPFLSPPDQSFTITGGTDQGLWPGSPSKIVFCCAECPPHPVCEKERGGE